MKLETQSSSARFCQSDMKMLIEKVEVSAWNNIILKAQMDDDQVRVAKSRTPRLTECIYISGIIIYLNMDNTGYETIFRQFAAKRLTLALTDERHSQQKGLLGNIMRLKNGEVLMEVNYLRSKRLEEHDLDDIKVEVQDQWRKAAKQ